MTTDDITPANMPGSFLRFAETADFMTTTTKRLEKAARLAEYFRSLEDADLAIAARYFAGHLFPLRDQRTTSVGGVAILAAIEAVSGWTPEQVRERLVVLGDPGQVAEEAFAAAGRQGSDGGLTLQSVAAHLDVLADTAGSGKKRALVMDLLALAGPLEAKYLVKLLAGDLRIGLQEGAVEDAIARWSGAPVGQVQWANMLAGDIGETAVMARHGRLAEAKMRLFHPIKFMLATPAADLADVARQMPVEFVVEDKFDGIRAQAHVARTPDTDIATHGLMVGDIRVALFSRTLDDITASFPDLLEPLAGLVSGGPSQGESGGIILDGEILPVQGDRILPFQELQKRLGRKTLPDALRASVPLAFVAYDILHAHGEVLIDIPFSQRAAVLDALPFDGAATRRAISTRFTDALLLDAEFDAARARGNEGLMVKDPASPYKPGRRGRDWLKIKRALATLDVVVTSVEVGNGGRSHLLSDYTFAVRASEDDPTLLNVGKAYSGLTDVELAEMSEWFRAHTVQEFAHGKVRTVEPTMVIEVTFDRVQPSARHKSGYALRFPRIVRLRPDKPAAEIDTLETVRKLAQPDER
jgi:DNA ligase-1